MVFIFETAILVFTNILIRGGKRFTLEPDLEIETNWSLWEKLGGKWSAVFLFRQKMAHLPVSNGIECFDFASVKGKQCPKLPMGIKKVQPLANTVPLCPPGKQWKLIWNFLICCQTNFGQNKCRAHCYLEVISDNMRMVFAGILLFYICGKYCLLFQNICTII